MKLPSPPPCTRTSEIASYVKAPQAVAIASYLDSIVNTMTSFVPVPDDVLHFRLDLETHRVHSQCVPPARPA